MYAYIYIYTYTFTYSHGHEPGCWGTSRAHGELKSPCTAIWRCAYGWPLPCISTTALQDLGMQLMAPPSSSLFFSGSACFGSRLSVGRLGLFLSWSSGWVSVRVAAFFGLACFGSRLSVGRLGLCLSWSSGWVSVRVAALSWWGDIRRSVVLQRKRGGVARYLSTWWMSPKKKKVYMYIYIYGEREMFV